MMFFENLLNHGSIPALATTLSFTEARHNMIAENIANLGTPDYKSKQLDTQMFQQALGEALDRRAEDPRKPFVLKERQFQTGPGGTLKVTPSLRPPDNLLFHDGTNASLEREMADLAENAMTHQMTSTLLRDKFYGLRKAIRGRV